MRLALHPNHPPVPLSRGSKQLMATLEHWKQYLDLVKSPHNGMTFDCGLTREMGEDPVAICRYLGERDVINHVHFRNVVVRKPYVDYTEVFLDDGQVDMFAVMRELVRQKYPRTSYPEHPRAIDPDRESGSIRSQYPGGGGFAGEIYNVAHARAMLQAALTKSLVPNPLGLDPPIPGLESQLSLPNPGLIRTRHRQRVSDASSKKIVPDSA